MAVTLQYHAFTIELFDDPLFSQTVDSPTRYDKVIQASEDEHYTPTTQYGLKIYSGSTLINSAIIMASGGGTTVDNDTALIDEDNLIICCCNKLFSLTLPDLITNWVVEVDWATCFSIHRYQGTYISYGEISIAKIDKSGKIVWSYSGADIFVCLGKGNAFEMHDTFIALKDFNGSIYKIDYDGNTIEYKAVYH